MTDLLFAHPVDWPPLGGPPSVEVVTRSRGVRKANTDMKTCRTCGDAFSRDFFSTNGKQGRLRPSCRSCERLRSRRRAEGRREYHREQKRKSQSSRPGKKSPAASLKKRFQHRVFSAVRNGSLPRASATPCAGGEGCSGPHHWHHDSYLPDMELVVRCLCAAHHRQWHADNCAMLPLSVVS